MDGVTVLGALKAGAGIVSTFMFQWVPAASLSLGAGETNVLNPAAAPITSPVAFTDAASYLDSISAPGAYQTFLAYWGIYVVLAMLFSLTFFGILIYCVVRIRQLRAFEQMRFAATAQSVASRDVSRTQLRWNRVREQIASQDEQSWRLAILESDIMLNELLDTLGYRGETIADKMKNVPRADFNSIDAAWEAHRARNRVAHEGASMPLSEREANHVISLYERTFREFQFVE